MITIVQSDTKDLVGIGDRWAELNRVQSDRRVILFFKRSLRASQDGGNAMWSGVQKGLYALFKTEGA
jgi:hypothetical protein